MIEIFYTCTHKITICLYVVMCHVQEVTSLCVSLGTIYHDWGLAFIISSWQMTEYFFCHRLRFIIHIPHFILEMKQSICDSVLHTSEHFSIFLVSWENYFVYCFYFMKVGERNINSRVYVCMYPLRSVSDLQEHSTFPYALTLMCIP
jgi:hypothetical protein